MRRLTRTCWTQPTVVERAAQGVALRAFGWIRQLRGVGEELVGRLLAGADDPVAPGRRHGAPCLANSPVIRLRQAAVGAVARVVRHRATADLRPCIVAPAE